MKRVLSAVKPTGRMTLGNYIGAIRQFVQLQDEYEMFIFIANEHAITIPIEAKELRQNTKDLIALYLAAGLDPAKATIFLQTDVPAHAQLGWVMTCMSYMGELQRMTQYKSKTANGETGITAGLFTYPCLMAADILLYDAEYVPVGIDQKQHVELARDIALRFNKTYGDTFKMPEPMMSEVGVKIMDLQEPTKKMSKSDETYKGVILLLDDEKTIRKKIMSAVTDSDNKIYYDKDNKPGVSNLLTIYSSLKNISIEEAEDYFKDYNYGNFKKEVADLVVSVLSNIQTKYNEIINGTMLDDILDKGREKTCEIAKEKTLDVFRKVGLGRN